MENKNLKNKMEELFDLVLDNQIEVVKSGKATSADIANSLKIFKDNYITFEREVEEKTDKQEEYLNSLRIELQNDEPKIQTITMKKRDKLQEYIEVEKNIEEDIEDFIEGVLNE